MKYDTPKQVKLPCITNYFFFSLYNILHTNYKNLIISFNYYLLSIKKVQFCLEYIKKS